MNRHRSKHALMEFLDYLGRKGLMNRTTATARKAAVNNVLSVLDDDEASDLARIDLDDVMRRFHNLNGMKYTTDSLATYKSRVRSAIDDFLNYVENPLAFRPNTSGSRKPRESGRVANGKSQKENSAVRILPDSPDVQTPRVVGTLSLPIPIRADLTVYVQGLPHDLTQSEASKIANVVRAMAVQE